MKGKKIISLICAITLLSLSVIPANANSAAPFWEGADGNGVVAKDGNIPILVENELLTFDLQMLPYARHNSSASFLAYDGKVTAEYTFYNPTDMTITATLLFPFGDYAAYGRLSLATQMERYGVYINGEKIQANIRHTNIISNEYFDTNAHIATMHDDFVEDDFYSQDLTVTKYSYEIVGHTLPSAFFNININHVGSERIIVLSKGHLGGHITQTGEFSMSSHSSRENEKKVVHFYVFGKPLTAQPDASWYKSNGTNPETKIDGEYRYLGSEATTLYDFIFSQYDAESGISEVDWYNACISRFKILEESQGTTRAIRSFFFGGTMRWYEYEVVFQPGEKINNTVVAPMYPSISAFSKPYQYTYTYLLSPASCWADFGNLDIVINTPYEMSKVNIQGFEKTETGYKLNRQGLPQGENGYEDLRFTLLNDGNTPLKEPGPNSENTPKSFFDAINTFFNNILKVFKSIVNFIKSMFTNL